MNSSTKVSGTSYVKANKKKWLMLIAVLQIVIVIILYLIMDAMSVRYTDKLIAWGVVSLVVIGWIVLSQVSLTKDFDIFTIMMLLAAPFYFGHHYVLMLGKDVPWDSAIKLVKEETNLFSGAFILISLLLVYVGYLSSKPVLHQENNPNCLTSGIAIGNSEKDSKVFRNLGIIIFFVTVIPTMYYRIFEITLNFTYGYIEGNKLRASISGFAYIGAFVSDWFVSSIYILLITNSKKKASNVFFFMVSLGYCCLYLAGGSRYAVIEIATGLLLIRHVWVKRINRRKMIMLSIVGIFALLVFSALPEIRLSIHNTNNKTNLVGSEIGNILDTGLLTNVLEETGITYATITNVLDKCPSVVPHSFGYSILGFFILLLPSFLRFGLDLEAFSVSSTFSGLMLGSKMVGGYGSSYIAEAYYNFGYLIIVYLIIFGRFLCRISNKLKYFSRTRDAGKFFLLIYLCGRIVFTIRTDLVSIGRYYVYFALLPYIVYRMAIRNTSLR
ncbi:MAG: O-antigen polysaccharide polymerase Wzy [Christensenellaceae bacterium]